MSSQLFQNNNKGDNKNMNSTSIRLTTVSLTLAMAILAMASATTQAADIGTTYLQLPISLESGKQKVVGAVLARPVLKKAEVVSAVSSGNVFTSSESLAAYVPVTTAIAGFTGSDYQLAPASDDHYIVEFTSGPHTGLLKRVTAISGTSVTVSGNLPVIDAGTRFVLRKDHTLASLFGDQTSATASGILAGSAAGSADQFGIFNASGKLVRFFLRSGAGWRDSADRNGVNRNHVRVSMGTGVLMLPAGNKTIYLNGEYRGTRSKISITEANSFLANPYPVAVTLANSGLAGYLLKGSAAGSADQIRFMESGKFIPYFANNSSDFKLASNRTGPSQSAKEIAPGEGFAVLKAGSTARDVAWAPQYLAQ